MQRIVALIILVLAACGGGDGSPPGDASPPPSDAATAPPLPTLTDLTGGGRLTGGTLVVDVQIGHPIARTPASGGAVVVDPAAPIKP